MHQISQELSALYKELPKRSHISTKSFQIEVEDMSIGISVIMHKIRNREEEEEMAIRRRLYIHNVSIFIILPLDIEIGLIVQKHFNVNSKANLRKLSEINFNSIKMSYVLEKEQD